MILLWVQDELSYDGFHSQVKNIYRLENQVGTGKSIQIWRVTNKGIAMAAKAQIPAVKDAVRITDNYFYQVYKFEGKTFPDNKSFFTDPSFFSLFDFHLIKGNNSKPFPADNSVVMTESTAKKFFGDQDPLGKVISGDGKANFTVTGIILDFPKNSSITGEMFFPM